jgi:hypothetical protein
MAQYLNLEVAPEENQQFPVEPIFEARWIFAQDAPAFGTHEICATYTIPKDANLFELSSHTHLRGVKWRTWGPPNEPCQPGCPDPIHPIPGQFGNFQLCNEDPALPICEGPRDDTPIYTSTDYTDPLQLRFDPPIVYDSENEADRTFLYCSLFDNGTDADSPPVKRRSTTPMPPGISPVITAEILNFYGLGGPCAPEVTVCADGPNRGQSCAAAPAGVLDAADHALCGDPELALCDACPARGGVTTEDEMFILMGAYYVPEPGATSLGGAVLAALAWHARRRSRTSTRSI